MSNNKKPAKKKSTKTKKSLAAALLLFCAMATASAQTLAPSELTTNTNTHNDWHNNHPGKGDQQR